MGVHRTGGWGGESRRAFSPCELFINYFFKSTFLFISGQCGILVRSAAEWD